MTDMARKTRNDYTAYGRYAYLLRKQKHLVAPNNPLPGLRVVRLSRELTQKELADKMGCSMRMICNLENNTAPSYWLLLALAEVLDTSLDALVYGRLDDDAFDVVAQEDPMPELV